jgi:hypothetical protein
MTFPQIVLCQFGDHFVDTNSHETYHEITAWVNGPKKDGGVLRRQTSRMACKPCIDAMRAGHAPGQGDLFTLVSKEQGVNKSTATYRQGWKHGFLGHHDPDLASNHEYAVGKLAGQEMSGHLDGYFFFEGN